MSVLGDGEEFAYPTFEEQKRLNYLTCVIKETLRLYPSVPFLPPRELQEDAVVGGYEIPKKTLLIVDIYSIHHNPKYWKNPDVFDPTRFSEIGEKQHAFAWLGFGAGTRSCIGQNFSMIEQRVVLSAILKKFEILLPGEGLENKELQFRPTNMLFPEESLKLVFKERIKA